MTKYQNYTVEEFAMDGGFRNWVLSPTPELALIWKNWLSENPDKLVLVNQAKELVLTIHEVYQHDVADETINKEIREITRLAELSNHRQTRSPYLQIQPVLWKVAAAVLLAVGLGYLYNFKHITKKAEPLTKSAPVLEKMLVKTNDTQGELTVLLSDNSVATLKTGSTITYPRHFARDERKVLLSGEAFFDVAKDPKKPFLVFANETVTKVLGTSFRVRAFEQDNTVMVVVKTGKVSVYPKKEYETLTGKDDREVAGVVLNPNQQVVFIRNQNRLEKGIVANPGMLIESSIPKELVFDDKPVSEVLRTLENIYGIVIVFDPESLNNCVISAQFDEENLKQRMNAICQAIGASYEMVDGQIIINSKGCNN